MWMELSSTTYLYFFSTSAQVFGALLGLVGLSYVRSTEIIDANLRQMLSSLTAKFVEVYEKKVQKLEDDTEIKIDSTIAMKDKLNEIKTAIGESTYQQLSQMIQEVDEQVDKSSLISKSFRYTCILLVIVTILSLVGVATADMVSSTAAAVFIATGIITATASVILAARIFIQSSKLARIFIFYKQ